MMISFRNPLLFHAILVVGLLSPGFVAHGKILEKIHAIVNGEPITLTDINTYRGKLKNGGFVNDLLFGSPEERQKSIESREYLVKKLIDEKILESEIKKNGFVVSQDRVEKEIATIAKSKGASVAQMKQVLGAQNIKFSEYQEFIRKSIERRQLVEKEISSKIKVSEQDITGYYSSKEGGSSRKIFSYSLAHILLNPDQRSLAKKLAVSAKKGDFSQLVKTHSQDPDGKENGGDFGVFRSGEMLGSVENAIRSLKTGGTSGVVETPMGLHIFKVTKKKLINNPTLEKERPQIQQLLFAKAFKEQLSFWLSQKRKDAIVQMN